MVKRAKYDWVTKGRHRSRFRKETTEEGRKEKSYSEAEQKEHSKTKTEINI